MTRKDRLSQAIDRLAEQFEFGALQVATDPSAFLDRVTKEIARLRLRSDLAVPAEPGGEERRGSVDDKLEFTRRECEAWQSRAEKAEAEVAGLNESVAAMQERDRWPACACSYDAPGDVCATHSPRLAAAESESIVLRSDLAVAQERARAWEAEAGRVVMEWKKSAYLHKALEDGFSAALRLAKAEMGKENK